MTDRRIIAATFSDWRCVKGRKVLQLVFEVPIEQQTEVLTMLGPPGIAEDKWVAIALLNEKPAASGGDRKPSRENSGAASTPLEPPQAPEPKPKRDRSLSELCAIACADARFQEFLDAKHRKATDGSVTEAVRRICCITSRSHLNADHPNFNPEAARKWIALHQEFRNYVADLEYGEARR